VRRLDRQGRKIDDLLSSLGRDLMLLCRCQLPEQSVKNMRAPRQEVVCVHRTTGRLSSGSRGSLGGEELVLFAGWLSRPLLLQLLWISAPVLDEEGCSRLHSTLHQDNRNGSNETNNGRYFQMNQRGQELYCTCRWHRVWGSRIRKNESR
jgi:hypothetical protein